MDAPVRAPFALRQATRDDLAAVLGVIVACDTAAYGTPDFTLDDLEAEWRRPGFDPARDTWLLIDEPTGQLAAYAELWGQRGVRLQGAGFVDPRFRGRGLGTALVELVEARAVEWEARAPAGAQVVLQQVTQGNDAAAQVLLAGRGYGLIRHFSRMVIDLDGAPDVPAWPDGITCRSYRPGSDDRAVFDAVEDSFRDHWGRLPSEYEGWIDRRTGRSGFDPGLWLLAVEGETIAGVALCHLGEDGGWVDSLGVRRPWRRRGLGMALLQAAFVAFHERGIGIVKLGVDAQSLTGATRLYERAGMRVERQYAIYERVLRDGEPLAI